MKRIKYWSALVLVGLFVMLGATSTHSSSVDTLSDEGAVNDRYWCLWECRERYGLNPMFRGGGGSSEIWRLYAICVADCEKKFWKEWEKELERIK